MSTLSGDEFATIARHRTDTVIVGSVLNSVCTPKTHLSQHRRAVARVGQNYPTVGYGRLEACYRRGNGHPGPTRGAPGARDTMPLTDNPRAQLGRVTGTGNLVDSSGNLRGYLHRGRPMGRLASTRSLHSPQETAVRQLRYGTTRHGKGNKPTVNRVPGAKKHCCF